MHPSRHTNAWAAGPSTHNKIYASTLHDHDSLFNAYEHLTRVPDSEGGLTRLRRIASMVKPIMRKRGWHVQVLTEFMPEMPNLLGLNINKGYKICVRLRYSHNPGTFIPFEETVDTMLHELSHIIWGAHDANFHALWDELRDEYETLVMKGYSGEGFLTKGNRLGGGRVPPRSEIQRLARLNAEKRRISQKGSGQKVGGNPLHRTADIRRVIADAAERRNRVDRGCASGTADANRLADQASQQTFTTKAEEDDANNRAIAEALLDLMEEEEARNMHSVFTSPSPSAEGLAWSPELGLYSAEAEKTNTKNPMSEEEQMRWALQESMRGSRPSSILNSRSVAPDWRRAGSSSVSKPDARPAKRARSELATGSVLRFRNPEVLQNKSASNGALSGVSGQPPAAFSGAVDSWTCEICTCINPLQFLACDACAIERPAKAVSKVQTKPMPQHKEGWYCRECATFMENKWWTCSGCGLMKDTS